MEGVHVVEGRARESGGRKSPSGMQGQRPGRGSGRRSPPEAEAKCEINVQFLTFSCIKFLDLMNTRAGKEEYILQTHSTKFI